MQFDGATAVITGAGGGIGRELARCAAARKVRVAVVDIDASSAQRVAREITESGGQAIGYGCDVGKSDAVNELAARVEADFGELNLLFNNAGVYVNGPLDKTKPADAAWMLTVNVLGMVHSTQAFLPALRGARAKHRLAHIINTGSENSFGVPVEGPHVVYTATKHAVLGLSDALRRDLAESGIGVSVLCPGVVITNLFDSRRNRPSEFGGPRLAKPEIAKIANERMNQGGQRPERCAELCFRGLERGDFLIITDPTIRRFYMKRHAEVISALDRIDSTPAGER